ncbi:NupC/NupG family nucleoside CNT transporter [Vibrio scophthalmi]|uniref:Nucleoside permease n=1 Tax=Vibrio scophthalmi TaxID=45658 RepID=A0A1E3WID0_9VIBR|nr:MULTISPECIES: NupC/NupG family nucleoside CNT transporter [Vibrio]EGU35282.1 putative NupC family protein (permease) [Vibrio sp. N418]MCY9802555.1 NupC/NupG family nucleoside CNT transporter [Vibrio scophthalmi]ODS05564.1 putative nucleoside permease NupX [Vibrio scophthalmi]
MQIIFSLAGILALLACAYALSDSRRDINWRTIIGAFSLQAGFAALVLYFPLGQSLLGTVSDAISGLLAFADAGISFLFGDLASGNFIFAIRVLPLIIFLSSIISMLYYLGIMQKLIKVIGGGIARLLGTSQVESLAATSNIFLSMCEASLVVRPFLPKMTRSELFAVTVGGMASVAGSVLGGYAALGIELKYLIAASFMAAPGGLLMAKMMVPERETSAHQGTIELEKSTDSNIIDALASGAMNGVKVAVAVGAMLLAFVSVIAMVNAGFETVGNWFGFDNLTLQLIFGYLFAPLAFIAGIPMNEAVTAGALIGQKTILNEFVAFLDFVNVKDTLSAHSQVIITFALCGFANIGSIAIQLGSIGAMAPERRQDVAKLGFRAVTAATLANMMSAALAGLFIAL